MDLTLFEKYKTEIEEDLKIDEIHIKETQMNLPAIRHKWVARLIKQKYELSRLKKLKKEAVTRLVEKVRQEEPVALSDAALKKLAEKHDIITKVDEELENCEIMILYLEKVETSFRNTTFDIKNLVEIIKLEST
jgi:hypothetical protein